MKPSFYFYANPYQSRSISSARALQTEMEKRGAAVYTEAWLAREGLGGKSYLDINSFMKQYEKQQQYAKQNNINTNIEKGSTSNG